MSETIILNTVNTRDVGPSANGIDIQRIDTEELRNNNEHLPVEIVYRSVLIEQVLEKTEIRNTEYIRMPISKTLQTSCKDFDFIVENTLNKDVVIGFKAGSSENISIPLKVGTYANYGTGGGNISHRVEANRQHVKLSDIKTSTINDPEKTSLNPIPFKGLYLEKGLTLEAKAVEAPSSGSLRIYFVGVPN